MSETVEIIPTCVPRDVRHFASQCALIRSFSTQIHIDIDDGKFTHSFTWPYVGAGTYELFDLQALEGLQAEVHLMVQEPTDIGVAFARAGASRIVGHLEAFTDASQAKEALETWRASGALEVGLALLLDTPAESVQPLVRACDVVHFMTIASIGIQGIPYDPKGEEKIRSFHGKNPGVRISVDGGVSEKNIGALVAAGARRFGVGSAIFRADLPAQAYATLERAALSALQ